MIRFGIRQSFDTIEQIERFGILDALRRELRG